MGPRLLAKAAEHLPDVVILDLFMPVLDGCEAARLLKGDPRTAAIPIIALTALVDDLGRQAIEAGCNLVVAKPASFALLEREVRRLLRR
jgi:CheY-like chemotaxis protein